MELWVRSQDKEKLIKIKNISIFWENDWFIVGNITNDLQEFRDVIVLGEYKLKERALEVLDEIQELLRGLYKTNLKDNEIVVGMNIIYQMPED